MLSIEPRHMVNIWPYNGEPTRDSCADFICNAEFIREFAASIDVTTMSGDTKSIVVPASSQHNTIVLKDIDARSVYRPAMFMSIGVVTVVMFDHHESALCSFNGHITNYTLKRSGYVLAELTIEAISAINYERLQQ